MKPLISFIKKRLFNYGFWVFLFIIGFLLGGGISKTIRYHHGDMSALPAIMVKP